jgi:hypothetical protein
VRSATEPVIVGHRVHRYRKLAEEPEKLVIENRIGRLAASPNLHRSVTRRAPVRYGPVTLRLIRLEGEVVDG